MNASILAPLNRCTATGLEERVTFDRIGALVVRVFRDNFGQHRITVGPISPKEAAHAAILLDRHGVCRFKYTAQEHRRQRLTRHLFAWCAANGIRADHSDLLTEAGAASI